jgi:hypothetical protein
MSPIDPLGSSGPQPLIEAPVLRDVHARAHRHAEELAAVPLGPPCVGREQLLPNHVSSRLVPRGGESEDSSAWSRKRSPLPRRVAPRATNASIVRSSSAEAEVVSSA